MKQPLSKYLFNEYSRCKERFWSLINKDLVSPEMDVQTRFFKKQTSLIKDLLEKQLSENKEASYERNKKVTIGDELAATVDFYETHHKFGKTAIFEVRATKSIKKHHLWDLAYLTYVYIESGAPLRKVFLVHPNPNYILREGDEIIPQELLVINDVSKKVFRKLKLIKKKVEEIIAYAKGEMPSIALSTHSCRSKKCIFIQKYHPNLTTYSVYDFKGLNRNQLQELLAAGIFEMKDIPESYIQTSLQKNQMTLALQKEVILDYERLHNWFAALQYPLYFLDYEALTSAFPLYSKSKPFQHIVFQYSLHVKKTEESLLEHYEFLPTHRSLPLKELLNHLRQYLLEDQGSILVYHDSFEKSRNREMALLCPTHAAWLENINKRIVDMEKLFMPVTGIYQHFAFDTKTSLKKIFSVLLPQEQKYSALEISDGMTAAIQWFNYLQGGIQNKEQWQKTREDLLAYCKLDTFAMAQIFEFLRNKLKNFRKILE